MSHTSMILTGLMLAAMVLFFTPGILAMNRGNILRNIALWLAIFLGLALFYQNFGPDSKHPLFNAPASMTGMRELPPDESAKQEETKEPGDTTDAQDKDQNKDQPAQDSGEQGYTPPKE